MPVDAAVSRVGPRPRDLASTGIHSHSMARATGRRASGKRARKASRHDSRLESAVLRRAFVAQCPPFWQGVALSLLLCSVVLLVACGAAGCPLATALALCPVTLAVEAGVRGCGGGDPTALLALSFCCRCVGLARAGRRLRARALHLPEPPFAASFRQIDSATTTEGHVLRATLVTPQGEAGPWPVVLLRTPYGRHAEFGQTVLAEMGYAVVVQDTRGRFGSDGTFVPVAAEREDGAATVRWIKEQPFYNGRLAVYGISYLGFTAWACAGGEAAEEVDLVVPVVSQSRVRSACFLPGGGISLELIALWLYLVLRLLANLHRPYDFFKNALLGFLEGLPQSAMLSLPLKSLDTRLTGEPIPFFQDALAFPAPDGPFWATANVLCDFQPQRVPPVHIVTGWYDFFLQEALQDFQRARRAGQRSVSLTVGDFAHWDLVLPEAMRTMYTCLLGSLDECLRQKPHPDGKAPVERSPRIPFGDRCHPICVQVINSGEWLQMDEWPPEAEAARLYLTREKTIQWQLPRDKGDDAAAAAALSYVYRSARPTPAAGGPSFNFWNSGKRHQFWIERRDRDDLLVFTSSAMGKSIEIVGDVSFTAYVSTTAAASFDVVARLCTVSPWGYSHNICEGLTRVDVANTAREQGHGGDWDPSTVLKVHVSLGASACAVPRGHRIRVHITSAAHPRWMRNLGTADLAAIREATSEVAEHETTVQVHASPMQASFLTLPLLWSEAASSS